MPFCRKGAGRNQKNRPLSSSVIFFFLYPTGDRILQKPFVTYENFAPLSINRMLSKLLEYNFAKDYIAMRYNLEPPVIFFCFRVDPITVIGLFS